MKTTQAHEIEIGVARDAARSGTFLKGRASGNDMTAIAFALEDGLEVKARAHRYYHLAKLSRVEGQSFLIAGIAYPTILANMAAVDLSVEQLIEEVELVCDMGGDAEEGYPLVYSLQVISPSQFRWPASGPSLSTLEPNPARRAELETGYVYHNVLYGLENLERETFLAQIFAAADTVEVVVRADDTDGSIRTVVRLTTDSLALAPQTLPLSGSSSGK